MTDPRVPVPPALTIGALSKRTGCKVETIRYYERIKMMPEPMRTVGGHRLYREADLKQLTFIRRGRELGFTLGEVRSLLSLVDSGSFTCAEVKAITLDHLGDIRRKVSDLRKLAKVLQDTADLCDGGVSNDCPIVDTLYQQRGSSDGTARQSPPRSGGME
ncbi:MAG: helix-turn-helix domain-containing protein [Kiloniellales bacterium]